VAQANRLVAAGFAYVWLSILVTVDSRELTRPTGGYLAADLDGAAGAVVCELTQCFDSALSQSGMLGGGILRMASQNSQPAGLTAAIATLIGGDPSLRSG